MIIFKHSLRRILNSKFKIAILLIAPFVAIMLFAVSDVHTLNVGVADRDASYISRGLINKLKHTENVKIVKTDKNSGKDMVDCGRLDYLMIINKGFGKKIVTGEKIYVTQYLAVQKEGIPVLKSTINNYIFDLNTLAAGVRHDRNRFRVIFNKFGREKLMVKNLLKKDEKEKSERAAMGFLVQFMLYMSIATAGIILEDKVSGTFYRTLYAPVSLKRYMAESLAAFCAVAFVQVTLVFCVLRTVFGFGFAGNILSVYGLLLAFSFVCIAFGIWMISIFKKPISAYAVVTIITTPLVMLGGCYWKFDIMPDYMRKIGLFIPTTWVMKGLDKILYQGKNMLQIGFELFTLILFAGVFFAAGMLSKVEIGKNV